MPGYRALRAAAALCFTAACARDSAVGPTPVGTSSGAPAATIALVSGNDQHGKAGEPLDEPLVVRVTDPSGRGVSNHPVSFEIASGGGVLGERCEPIPPVSMRSSGTDTDGIARMAFLPTVLGRSTVIARLGAPQQSIIFTVETTVLVVEFWFGYWNVGFVGPCTNSSDVVVPAGTPVEWRIPVQDDRYPVTYTVTSTSTAVGAAAFDSGVLTSRDRFRFVPAVAGTWHYRDSVTGLTGTLTAK
jgi:hypothetical protein